MKNIGIWLDKEKALLVTIENGVESLITIPSNIDHFHVGGGSGTRFKGGPQDVVQDRKYLEKENHQLKEYFKNIASKIKDADGIALFGPAQTYEKFEKELSEHYKYLSVKIKGVKKSDSMTTNQVNALVRSFFNGQ
jgi:stalled ribosome rescue protein Dom34